jgi:hypothetical protein
MSVIASCARRIAQVGCRCYRVEPAVSNQCVEQLYKFTMKHGSSCIEVDNIVHVCMCVRTHECVVKITYLSRVRVQLYLFVLSVHRCRAR